MKTKVRLGGAARGVLGRSRVIFRELKAKNVDRIGNSTNNERKENSKVNCNVKEQSGEMK